MDSLTYYYQERVDAAWRTGLEVNNEELLELFHEGDEDQDPRLLWYVDLRCQGDFQEITSSEAGRGWLVKNGPALKSALAAAADEVHPGLDLGFEPWQWTYPAAPAGLSIRVVVSVARRLVATEVSVRIRGFAEKWDSYIARLQPPITVP